MRVSPSGVPRRGLGGARWIVVLVVAFFAVVAFIQIRAVVQARSARGVGDGRDPASYGFDLASLDLPRETLAAGGMPRDGLVPLRPTARLTPSRVDSLNRAVRGKYLTPDDRVIGVVIGGVARAYPLRVLNWHEVALDSLAGVPIAVCWHPLSGAAVVLDRRHDGRVVELRVSGLLASSHHLLYDPADDSLWAPLLARAVAGPARGDTLAFIPHALARWDHWCAAYPATTVPAPGDSLRQTYEREPYGNYEGSDLLRFPAAPLPDLGPGERHKDLLAIARDASGIGQALRVEAGADSTPRFALVHAYRFAWHALGQSQRLRRK